jgi:hypothetical protein
MAIVIASPRAESWDVAGVVRPGFCVSFILGKKQGKMNHSEPGWLETIAWSKSSVARTLSSSRGSRRHKLGVAVADRLHDHLLACLKASPS